MSIFVLTGRHLSWLACLLLAFQGPTVSVYGAEELSSSVKSELLDLSRAFRSLDQSYQYRGMSSRLASTAGSVFVDWEAKGVPPELRHPAVAPAPVLVGCAEKAVCHEHCECNGRHHDVPQSQCSDCGNGSLTPLHGSGSSCAATIGIPLHPRCNDCAATIGIPLHPHAFARHNCGCGKCRSPGDECRSTSACDTRIEAARCDDCCIVEQYRNGNLTRTLVPCDRCQANLPRE